VNFCCDILQEAFEDERLIPARDVEGGLFQNKPATIFVVVDGTPPETSKYLIVKGQVLENHALVVFLYDISEAVIGLETLTATAPVLIHKRTAPVLIHKLIQF
jgi:hypothetical protein